MSHASSAPWGFRRGRDDVALNVARVRQKLFEFNFSGLFIEELGWGLPTLRKPFPVQVKESSYSAKHIAQLQGVPIIEVQSPNGVVPDSKTRAAIHKEISGHHHENILIFVDGQRTQSLWYWVKRQDGKSFAREHPYMKGQTGDLFLGKLSALLVELKDLGPEGDISLLAVTGRLKNALDVERVTKRFYTEFQDQHIAFLDLIRGIDDDRDRRWYASVLLNRLMFIYFLQKKLFLDGGTDRYLQDKLAESRQRGTDRYFEEFLKALFFEGFAKPEDKRDPKTAKLLGKIKYLNGGLFLPHPIEQRWPKIAVPDKAFDNLFALFDGYSWNLDDTPGGQDNEINPDVLGYIFEKYINQKAFGAYYTRPEITEYLCERTVHRLILDAVSSPEIKGVILAQKFESISDLLFNLDAGLCRRLIHDVLPGLRLLDPACGSGAFLVAAMKTLVDIYAAVVGKIKFLSDQNLTRWLADIEKNHPSPHYFIKKTIITQNLYGVDVMEEAVEIAKLRLFLALVAAARTVDDLEPLPNIDFNILAGNSLIGLTRVDAGAFDASLQGASQGRMVLKYEPEAGDLGFPVVTATAPTKKERVAPILAARAKLRYTEVLAEKNRLIRDYRNTATFAEDLSGLRDNINKKKQEAITVLNQILLDEFNYHDIKVEQAVWDEDKEREGRPVKRSLTLRDIEALKPFHWGFEFDEIVQTKGGFDAIITNPPWEIFKPIAKEFCYEFDPSIERRGTNIKDFEERLKNLLKNNIIRKKYLEYVSRFPHISAFYRSAPQYRNQISNINGKKAGTDINLYKLFSEQCFNLLRNGGYCGLVTPSGIYTDLGTKQLREMLFTQTKITGLFCFENRKEIFENVHRSFKFAVLTFEKGGQTKTFPAAFMQLNVDELSRFPKEAPINISVDFVRRLSPNSLSVVEFRNELDGKLAQKFLKFPFLGHRIDNSWNPVFYNEFHMTNDSALFKTAPRQDRFPLYEGKMIWHLESHQADARYWVDKNKGRAVLLGRTQDKGQELDYQQYRFAYRSITGNTNERTMVCSMLPPNCFFGHSLNALSPSKSGINVHQMLYFTAVMASLLIDYAIRQRVSTQLTMFFVYQIPVPRLTGEEPAFHPIIERAARLICTTPEFDGLAKDVGLGSHKKAATTPTERAKIRAELDALVAHLYGLTEDEFQYVLSTFPLVATETKRAALIEFQRRRQDL